MLMSPELSFVGDWAGGILYSDDYQSDFWDDADPDLQTAIAGFTDGRVETYKHAAQSASAGLDPPFVWTLHGGLKCYLHPKMEISILELGGPYVEGGPYLSLDAWAHRNLLEFAVGVEAVAGGEFNPLGQGPFFDWHREILDQRWPIWRYTWKWCGDGTIDTQCGEACEDTSPTAQDDGCRADCMKVEICGDGELDLFELCEHTAPTGTPDLGCDAANPNCSQDCFSCQP
jgi:hypothetical protein